MALKISVLPGENQKSIQPSASTKVPPISSAQGLLEKGPCARLLSVPHDDTGIQSLRVPFQGDPEGTRDQNVWGGD
jgi:hypothetical protein